MTGGAGSRYNRAVFISAIAAPMTHPIRTRIDDFRQQKRVHANSLIISLFGDIVVPRGGRIWLGSLVGLLEPLGLRAAMIRTAMFRLTREEWLHTEALGRRSDYLLTASGQRRFDEASRHIYASRAPRWDGRWRLIVNLGQIVQKERDALRRALFWRGFGALGLDCFVHPGADLSDVFDALRAEGIGHLRSGLMPLLADDARLAGSASNADLVARAWSLGELSAAYRQFMATYQPALAGLQNDPNAPVNEEDAFLMRLLLIHDYRRLLLRDPELPDVLVPVAWPGQTARVLCKALYRRLLAPSERHLDFCLRTANGSCPPLGSSLIERFPDDEPLTEAVF